jgi:glycosyltransferase involved in cell wall biosynthesis
MGNQSMLPTISVCIPTFNGEKYLKDCLESVLGQEFGEIEILIVDDCSTDGTLDIIHSYAKQDRRIKIEKNPVNLGLVGNWNRCLELATGEWIKFVFQDDLIAPTCLKKMLEACQPNTSLVYCRRGFIFEPDVSEATQKTYINQALFCDRIFSGITHVSASKYCETVLEFIDRRGYNPIGEPTVVMLHRSVPQRFGRFNPHTIQSCDEEYWSRVAIHTGLTFVDEALASFRVHLRSTTLSNQERRHYRALDLDPLVKMHEIALSPVYEPLRQTARQTSQPIDFIELLEQRAYTAWLKAKESPDPTLMQEWDNITKYYPILANLVRQKCDRTGASSTLSDSELVKRDRQIEQLNRDLRLRNLELSAIQNSLAWKASSPIRAIGKLTSSVVRSRLGKWIKIVYWLLTFQLNKGFQQIKWINVIEQSDLFDADYYLEQNPDVKVAGMVPLIHYVNYGASEKRNPNPLFDTAYYLEQNPDVADVGINPLVHYIIHGVAEGRNPNPLFDTAYYLEQNPDIAIAGVNPLAHYLKFGANEGRNPSALFNTIRYQEFCPDVAKSGLNPLVHYLLYGNKDKKTIGVQSAKTVSQTKNNKNTPVKILAKNKGDSTEPIPTQLLTVNKLKDSLKHKKVKESNEKHRQTRKNNTGTSIATAIEKYADLAAKTTVSVVIPVKNGGDDLRLMLPMHKKQRGFKAVEIVVVDSGSTDGSLEFAMEMGAKTIQILPEEFSHSYARNLGAQKASGDYLLFTVQDALPPSEEWLLECFSLMRANGTVAASCTEFPRDDVDLFNRIMFWNHEKFMEVALEDGDFLGQRCADRVLSKPKKENYIDLRKNAQLSDVACLIDRELFLKYKYQKNYAEDLDLGLRLIRDGHQLALLGSSPIIHSHNRSPYYHLKRGYVDGLHLGEIFPSQKFVPSIDPEQLLRHMVCVYAVLNETVAALSKTSIVPCTASQLVPEVVKLLQNATPDIHATITNQSDNPYVDSQFREFVEKVGHQYCSNGNNNVALNGILFNGVRGFVKNIVSEYMIQTYDAIDTPILEEFKACLYKVLAFQSGSYLIHSYLESSASTQEKLLAIHAELTKGV